MTSELTTKLKTVLGHERRELATFLRLLAEADQAKLYAEEAYPSLFEYCTGSLGLKEGEAYNRIRACRVAQRFPEVFALLEAGDLCLTTVRLLAPYVDHADFRAALGQAKGLSTRAVEKLAASLEASAAKKPRSAAPAAAVPLGFTESEAPAPVPAKRGAPDRVRYVTPERVQVSFTADEALVQKLERVQALRRVKGKDGGLDETLAAALDAYLDKHDPAVVMKRRRERATKRQAAKAARPPESAGDEVSRTPDQPETTMPLDTGPASTAASLSVKPPRHPSRYVPASVAAETWGRDDDRCTFTTADGHRCPARVGIQMDHDAMPFALGGTSTNAADLGLLCRTHNLLMAERVYGKAKIAAFIAS